MSRGDACAKGSTDGPEKVVMALSGRRQRGSLSSIHHRPHPSVAWSARSGRLGRGRVQVGQAASNGREPRAQSGRAESLDLGAEPQERALGVDERLDRDGRGDRQAVRRPVHLQGGQRRLRLTRLSQIGHHRCASWRGFRIRVVDHSRLHIRILATTPMAGGQDQVGDDPSQVTPRSIRSSFSMQSCRLAALALGRQGARDA
jgi:hypothetical protein